ncbi:hypothetical protein QYE76_038889 [Lolium multiflorum]|uniref:Arabidopsis retrotransposon Orf1 C-terminal domain-containing protein n=1 Tax=Lolium multiflorum TaxID=4521 RepID=A0AAD8TAF0_LOLMU|nr:hypothetical protein QYE76_038889 [Lolium multiflorum]
MWDALRAIRAESDLPWLVVGDFNEALWPEEHFSATTRPAGQMQAFRDALNDCRLTDLGFAGVPYTFDNMRNGRANVKVRLDRAVATMDWRDMYADTRVQHLISPCSDHCPILVSLTKEERGARRPQKCQYEVLWERAAELPEKIAHAWTEAGPKVDLAAVSKGLNEVMTVLQSWSKRKFGNILRELDKARKQLELLMLNGASQQEIRKASDHMQEMLYREELLWLQRSRISWLKEGDRNTRFFHQKAVWRARKNKIKKLKDDDGNWQSTPFDMERMATSYFKELFTRDPSLISDDLVGLFQEKVTPEMNEALCKDFSDEEIGDALIRPKHMREAKKSLKEKGIKSEDVKNLPPIEDICEIIPPSSMIEGLLLIAIKEREAMKKFNFGELFKKGTTSTGRPSRAATRIRRSYNEDNIAPSFAPEEDNGAPNASSFPCYDFLRNAGILEDFFALVNRAGLTTYVGDEREQYYMLTKIFVESFQFNNKQYEPTVAFRIYGNPVTMQLEDFCRALDIVPVGTASRIDDNPRDLLELYRGITDDDCRTIQRGKIRNIQLPAIKYFAYYIATSILGRENTSNISSYHLAFLNIALTGQTSYHLGALIARRLPGGLFLEELSHCAF